MRLNERVRKLEKAAPTDLETIHVLVVSQYGGTAGPLPPPLEYEAAKDGKRRRFIIEQINALEPP